MLALLLWSALLQAPAPAQHGLDPASLNSWTERLADRKTKALLVMRHGAIVHEWYAPGVTAETRQGTASLAKSLIGGMSLLVALEDNRLRVDSLASEFIPAWKSDPRKSKITIRQLATHSSGIEDAKDGDIPHARLTGWKGDFWKRRPDPISIAIHQAPAIFDPGARFHYSNPGMGALSYAVTASLKGTAHPDVRAALKARVLDPLGIPDAEWSLSYGEKYAIDGMEVYANWGGAAFTPRAAARIGQLMLQRGDWGGATLFHADNVRRMVSYAGTPVPDRADGDPAPGSGLCWWTNFDGVWPRLPRDAFAGAGAGQELLLVVPSLDLVVVRNGALLGAGRDFWKDAVEQVFVPAVEAVRDPTPYSPSPAIKSVAFAPESTIVRKALGSDNWPLTWGGDDALYTAYGDGSGFEPRLNEKLSLGFARITGAPGEFAAVNLRSKSGERPGDGKKGEKASGLLMVDGVLYMWVRNAGNARLAWSEDRGRTWQWGFRFDTGFGSPTFLNFGPGYRGARDRYVYVYSQQGPSAYETDDHLVLARAPKQRIRERGAWEFFAGTDGAGKPRWTGDQKALRPVFSFTAHCQRADAVYHPGLKRYLLALGYNHSGGWGVFDAPEPWGPWTTAFHTEDWGLGGTHGYRIPSKWISGDNLYLVFSGTKENDAFCVREMRLAK